MLRISFLSGAPVPNARQASREGSALHIVNAFDAAVYERNLTQRT
jgi:hypothetical protein